MRKYINTENFRAPIDAALPGLNGEWPDVRSYVDVSQFMQPYRAGYFHDNTLSGLGVEEPVVTSTKSTFSIIDSTKGLLDETPRTALLIGGIAIGFSIGALVFGKR